MWSVTYNVKNPAENFKGQRRLTRKNKEDKNNIVRKSLVRGFEKLKNIKRIRNDRKLGGLQNLR